MDGIRVGSVPCGCKLDNHPTRLVAVTGGPGAGKTAALELALHSFCSHVGVLPEAAGILFGGGFPRHDSAIGRRTAQRAIYHVERELEALALAETQVAIALCDRGTIDGLAYWPDPPETYWEQFGTTRDDELARYTAVIHLRTPGVAQGYNHSNTLRTETAAEALRIDQRILDAWAGHPNRVIIPSDDVFERKAVRALDAVRALLPACCDPQTL
ncbi:MAG: ATP-binding protein [Myxococcota bacterium]